MSLPLIWPAKPLAQALLLPALLSLAVFATEAIKPVVLALDLMVALAAIFDLLSLRGAAKLQVVRQCGTTCSLGERQQVTLLV